MGTTCPWGPHGSIGPHVDEALPVAGVDLVAILIVVESRDVLQSLRRRVPVAGGGGAGGPHNRAGGADFREASPGEYVADIYRPGCSCLKMSGNKIAAHT